MKSFIKSGKIEDVEEKAEGVNVLLRVSSENRDAEGDKFLKSAWANQEDKEYFLRAGRIDYNHLSDPSVYRKSKGVVDVAEMEKSRLAAIIGYPQKEDGLFWDESKNGLYCKAVLDPKNQYVKSMVSLMKTGFDRFEASAAGVMFSPRGETIQRHGEKTWDRARIQHIAICPPGEAINSDTRVILMKSLLKDIIEINQEEGQTMEDNFDPITDYIVNSQDYRKSVISKLTEQLALKSIPCDYEEIRDFFIKHKIPSDDAKEATKMILVKFNSEEI